MSQAELYVSPPSKEAIDVAMRCEALGKLSAQFSVFKLPHEYTADVSPTGEYEDTVEIERVIKVPLPSKLVRAAIKNMGATEPDAIEEKRVALEQDALGGYLATHELTKNDVDLSRLFGYPRTAYDMDLPPSIRRTLGRYPYIQDLSTPIPQAVDQLDIERYPWRAIQAFEWIDDIITKNTVLLPSRGLFDGIMKLDNWGRSKPLNDELVTKKEDEAFLDQTRLNDAYELMYKREAVLERVSEKFWRDIPGKPADEYTPLLPVVQEYFVKACDERITPDVIINNWQKDRPLSRLEPRLYTDPPGLYSADVPRGLCRLLIQKTLDNFCEVKG